jgi:hypothetical protein
MHVPGWLGLETRVTANFATVLFLEIQPKHLEPNAKGEGCTKVKGPFRITQKLQEWIGLIENPQGRMASAKHGLAALNVIC